MALHLTAYRPPSLRSVGKPQVNARTLDRRGGDLVHPRKLASPELGLHRDLRLRALRDAPDSFGETFAEAAGAAHFLAARGKSAVVTTR